MYVPMSNCCSPMIRLVMFCVRASSNHPELDVAQVSCLLKHVYLGEF